MLRLHRRPEPQTAKSKLGGLVGITGTPGTGKKSVAPMVAAALNLRSVSINEMARDYGLLDDLPDDAEVDVRKLRRKLESGLRGPVLVYGHLLPQVFLRDSMARVVVLRCDPTVLKKRLQARGYAGDKVLANIEAELIGLVSSEAFEMFGEGRTLEVDTSNTPSIEAARLVATAIKAKSSHGKRIDWTMSYDSARKLRSLLSTGTG